MNVERAREFAVPFLETSKILYGEEFECSNVHNVSLVTGRFSIPWFWFSFSFFFSSRLRLFPVLGARLFSFVLLKGFKKRGQKFLRREEKKKRTYRK